MSHMLGVFVVVWEDWNKWKMEGKSTSDDVIVIRYYFVRFRCVVYQ